ncbi:MAG: hypothetical protein AAB691_01725 [Patescibacteria group bacterium]
MVVTTTAIAFIVLSAGLGFCGWWFLRAFRKSGGLKNNQKIGFLLSLFFLGFSLHSFVVGLSGLFFPYSEIYFSLLVFTHSLLGLLALLGVSMIYHIFLPKSSVYSALLPVFFLGVLTIFITVLIHPEPTITGGNSLDFNLGPILSFCVWILSLISIGMPLIVFSRLFLFSKDVELKILSLLISVLAFLGIFNVSIQLLKFLDISENVRSKMFDAGISLVGVGFVIFLASLSFARKRLGVSKKISPRVHAEN